MLLFQCFGVDVQWPVEQTRFPCNITVFPPSYLSYQHWAFLWCYICRTYADNKQSFFLATRSHGHNFLEKNFTLLTLHFDDVTNS